MRFAPLASIPGARAMRSVFAALRPTGASMGAVPPSRLRGEMGSDRPDWEQANPRFIERASAHAQAKGGGGWVVLDASRRIDKPRAFTVAGREWVAWRTDEGVRIAPNECPHMGARLDGGRCEGRGLVCPWHGLRLDQARGAWRPRPVYDDGVLLWARLLDDEAPTERPVLVERVPHVLEGTLRMEAKCEPEDIVANRLDPWHGAHYHPHSFATLTVLDASVERIAVRVAYRAFGPFLVEVDCVFRAPTRRCIVMTITGGEGVGSVVETHATPLGEGRSAVIETTLAATDRLPSSRLAAFARPFIEARARRLWIEDIEYAERRYELRTRSARPRHLKVV
ncbi:MAG: DUF5914 domain-containing protein [Myxococcota bacterium]